MTDTVKDFAAPDGPILLLSAKGLTTAGIAEANGVKDFSGNENHGVGLNGVTVEESNGYDGFGFPNNNSYIKLSDKKDTIFTQTSAYTFSVTFVITSKPTRANGILVMWSFSSPMIQIWITSDYKLKIAADNNFTEYNSSLSIEVNTIYTITVSANYTTGHREVWANGNLLHIIDKVGKELTLNIGHLILGNHSTTTGYNLPGYIIDARIYPRALTQNEIKYLHNGFQPNIIVGQNILSGIQVGNLEAKKIYAGSNLIYVKTALYSSRPPVGTIKQIAPAGTAVYYATPHAVVLIPEYGGIKKLVIFDNVNLAFKIYETDGTRRSDTTYTDFSASNRFSGGALSIVEDPDGYIYAVGVDTGWVVKYRLKSTTQNGQTTYSMEQVAETKPGSLVAAGQISYCAARDSMIVVGWRSGGGTSIACQLSRDLSTATVVGQWSSPSIGGCFDQTGTRLYFCTYGSNKFAYMNYSSVSDTALKTSYTSTTVPPNYNSESLSSNDNRYVIAGTDGYMYMQMLNGSIFKYSAATESWVEKVGNIGSGASTTRCDYMGTYEYKNHSILYSKHDGGIYRLYL